MEKHNKVEQEQDTQIEKLRGGIEARNLAIVLLLVFVFLLLQATRDSGNPSYFQEACNDCDQW